MDHFVGVIEGIGSIQDLEERVVSAVKAFMACKERPKDLLVPEGFVLMGLPSFTKVSLSKRLYIYGYSIRIKPHAKDDISLTSYDSDHTISVWK